MDYKLQFKDECGEIISKAKLEFFKRVPRLDSDYLQNKKIYVNFIESPSSFYVIHDDTKKKFKSLEDNLNTYYNCNYVNLNIPKKYLSQNLNCVFFCVVDNKWKRGMISNVSIYDDMIEVIHTDEHSKSSVNKFKIYFLLKKFWNFPQQILNCRLSNIMPINSKYWSKESIIFFKREVPLDNLFEIYINNVINDTFYVNLSDLDFMQNVEDVIVQFDQALNGKTIVPYFPTEM